jgi:O-antigen/teichoic acid export membrane protein
VIEKVMRQRYQIIINAISNYATLVIYGIANFILVGYVVRKLGKDGFGLVSLVLSLTITTEILGRGICQALIKNVAAAVSKGEDEKVNEYLSTTVAWFTICAILGAIICGVAAVYIDRLFKIPAELIPTARLAVWIMAFRVLILFPFEAYQGILFAHQHYDLANLSKCVTIILRVLGVILYFKFFGAGVISLIVITIISLVLERISWVWFSLRISRHLRIKLSLVTRSALITLMSLGGFMMIIDVANMIGYEAVKWVIGFELSVQDVGAYTLIASIATFVGALVRAVANVLVPVASRYDALNRRDMNAQLALLSTKYAVIMSGGLCIVPLFMVKPLLALWVGAKYPPEYLSNLATAGMVLLVGQWVIGAAVSLLQMLTGVAKVRFPMAVTVGWAFGGLSGIWLYLHWVQDSLIAAVVGITIARILGSLVHLIYGMHIFGVRPIPFLLNTVLRPCCAGVVICALSRILIHYIPVYNPVQFVIVAVILASLYVLSSWTISLSSGERAAALGIVWSAINRLKVR